MKQKQNELMVLSEKSIQVQKMFDKIAPQYDFLNRLLSMRQDLRWRKYLVKSLPKIPEQNGILYDVACGTGDVLFATAKARDDYTQLTGFDISSKMLEKAQIRSAKIPQSTPIQFIQASAENLPAADESAHCLTISFGLRNVENRHKALQEFYRVLKPGGSLCVLEFFLPENTFIAKTFVFYFNKVLPRVGGLFSDKQAYQYLPDSVVTMPSGNEFKKTLQDIGFSRIVQKSWLFGATRLFKCTK